MSPFISSGFENKLINVNSFSELKDSIKSGDLNSDIRNKILEYVFNIEERTKQTFRYNLLTNPMDSVDKSYYSLRIKKRNEKNVSMIYSFSEQANNISRYTQTSLGLNILCNLLSSSSNFRLSKFHFLSRGLIEESTMKEISCINNEIYQPYLDIITSSEDESRKFFENSIIRLQCW